VTDEDLTAYIAALDKLPCGCTVNHVGRCLDAWALWEAVKTGWSDWHNGKIDRPGYFALCAEYLAHFENSAPAPETEAEPAQMGMGL